MLHGHGILSITQVLKNNNNRFTPLLHNNMGETTQETNITPQLYCKLNCNLTEILSMQLTHV